MSFDIKKVAVEIFNQTTSGKARYSYARVTNTQNETVDALDILYSVEGSKNEHVFSLKDIEAGKTVEEKIAVSNSAAPRDVIIKKVEATVGDQAYVRAATLLERNPTARKLANLIGCNR